MGVAAATTLPKLWAAAVWKNAVLVDNFEMHAPPLPTVSFSLSLVTPLAANSKLFPFRL